MDPSLFTHLISRPTVTPNLGLAPTIRETLDAPVTPNCSSLARRCSPRRHALPTQSPLALSELLPNASHPTPEDSTLNLLPTIALHLVQKPSPPHPQRCQSLALSSPCPALPITASVNGAHRPLMVEHIAPKAERAT